MLVVAEAVLSRPGARLISREWLGETLSGGSLMAGRLLLGA